MGTFVGSLSEKSKANWAEIYQQFMGKEWTAPKKDKRAIHVKAKLEAPEELEQIMQESPNYTIDALGRK
jgi:hypothetical protein